MSDIPAAVVLYQPPKPKSHPMIFTGVHPEIGQADINSPEFAEKYNASNQDHIQILNEQLQETEAKRKDICRSWLEELRVTTRK